VRQAKSGDIFRRGTIDTTNALPNIFKRRRNRARMALERSRVLGGAARRGRNGKRSDAQREAMGLAVRLQFALVKCQLLLCGERGSIDELVMRAPHVVTVRAVDIGLHLGGDFLRVLLFNGEGSVA
jgi:hypothetical protein